MSRNEDEAQSSATPRLSVGNRVRVRPGVRDPDFPDIPLGSWAGTVGDTNDDDAEGRLVFVEWNEATLRQMHPVYRYRCERDGLEIEHTWLYEHELELDIGEPLPLEQPTDLAPRPLDPGEQDDRVRAIFALSSDEPLPKPSLEWLARYHRFLSEHLPLPLEALYAETHGYIPGQEEPVQFVGLAPLEQVREENGLLAEIERRGVHEMVELFDIETPRNDYARQLIGDYSYWFCELFRYAMVEGGRQALHAGSPAAETSARPFVSSLIRSALYGAVCGMVVGAITATVPGARFALMIAAGLFAAAGYFLGSRLGFLLRALQLADKAPLLGSVFGTFAGAVLGAIVGAFLIAYPGTVLGSVFGYIVGRTLVMLGLKRPGGLYGGLLGAGIGGIALACTIDADRALIGLLSGAIVGAVCGVALALLFFASLLLFESRRNGSG